MGNLYPVARFAAAFLVVTSLFFGGLAVAGEFVGGQPSDTQITELQAKPTAPKIPTRPKGGTWTPWGIIGKVVGDIYNGQYNCKVAKCGYA